MQHAELLNVDNFNSGLLIVNKQRQIVFCNAYFASLCSVDKATITKNSLAQYFSKASNIFIDSYVYPLLLSEGSVQEIQLSCRDRHSKSIPVIVNINLLPDGDTYWSIYTCTNRDKLQTELIKAKEALEKKTQELFELATTDSLSGLLNRREFFHLAQKAVQQAMRNSSTLALLSFDIDYFKQVNDCYGHQMGDKVIQTVANILSENRRVYDVVARIGGEEFVVLLPDIDKQNAWQLAEKLRQQVAQQSIDGIRVTVSVGLCVTEKGQAINVHEMLRLSDNALYKAKNNGRNQTIIYQE
jgi:sigma-B regulation protein RsbQ